jgi:hypothetical protein
MFVYEQEIRVVLVRELSDPAHPERLTVGAGIDWDAEQHLENIWVHPDARYWLWRLSPRQSDDWRPACHRMGFPSVPWSKMNSPPPF